MAPGLAGSRRCRTLAASIVLVVAFITAARAQQPLCNGASTEGICKANGVGVWCNPCDSATYIVCRIDEPSKLETCGEGFLWEPSLWRCVPAPDAKTRCMAGVHVSMPFSSSTSTTPAAPLEALSHLLDSITGWASNLSSSLCSMAMGAKHQLREVLANAPRWSPDAPMELLAGLVPILPPLPNPSSINNPSASSSFGSMRSTMLLGHLRENPTLMQLEPVGIWPSFSRPVAPTLTVSRTWSYEFPDDYQDDESPLMSSSGDVSSEVAIIQEEALDLLQSAHEAALTAEVQAKAAEKLEAAVQDSLLTHSATPAVLEAAASMRADAAELQAQAQSMSNMADSLMAVAAAEMGLAQSGTQEVVGAATGATSVAGDYVIGNEPLVTARTTITQPDGTATMTMTTSFGAEPPGFPADDAYLYEAEYYYYMDDMDVDAAWPFGMSSRDATRPAAPAGPTEVAAALHYRLTLLANQAATAKLSAELVQTHNDIHWLDMVLHAPLSKEAAALHDQQRQQLAKEVNLVLEAAGAGQMAYTFEAATWSDSLIVSGTDVNGPHLVVTPPAMDLLRVTAGGSLEATLQQQLAALYKEALTNVQNEMNGHPATTPSSSSSSSMPLQALAQQQQQAKPAEALTLGVEAAWRAEDPKASLSNKGIGLIAVRK